jgi:hypothetical protein
MAVPINPSISPSEGHSSAPRPARAIWGQVAQTGLWTLLSLSTIDLSINLLFPYKDGSGVEPSAMARYFDYGRSIGGKLDRILGKTEAEAGPLANVGWLTPEVLDAPSLPSKPAPGKRLVAFYGMSFTNQIAEEMARQDPTLSVRLIGAPAAPPSYAYAAYKADRGRHQADTVVLGVLSQSIAAMSSTNGATWMFEGPSPYTFPKYSLVNGKLESIAPTITTPQQMREALNAPPRWADYQTELATQDPFYSPWVYDNSWTDRSVLLRLLRRSLAKNRQRSLMEQTYDKTTGFKDPKINETLKALVLDFAKTARADGKQPIVMILDVQGYRDHGTQLLKPTLDQAQIPYISTYSIADSTDRANFVPDGHFVPVMNQRIAAATLKRIGDRPTPTNRPQPK